MGDEIKIKGVGRTEEKRDIKIKIREKAGEKISEARISETGKILAEFVPKVKENIEKTQYSETPKFNSAEVSNALIKEIIKSILAEKIK